MAELSQKEEIIQTCVDCILNPASEIRNVNEAIERIYQTIRFDKMTVTPTEREQCRAAAGQILNKPGLVLKLTNVLLQSDEAESQHDQLRIKRNYVVYSICLAFKTHVHTRVHCDRHSEWQQCIELTLSAMRKSRLRNEDSALGLLGALWGLVWIPINCNLRQRIVCADVFEYILSHFIAPTGPRDITTVQAKMRLFWNLMHLEGSVGGNFVWPRRERVVQLIDYALGNYTDYVVLQKACSCVYSLFRRHPQSQESEQMSALVRCVIKKLSNLLLSNDTNMMADAIKGLKSCICCVEYLQFMLESELLVKLSQVVARLDDATDWCMLVKRCIIFSGESQQSSMIDLIIANNIVQPLINSARNSLKWIEANGGHPISEILIFGTDQHCLFLVSLGVIPLLCDDKFTQQTFSTFSLVFFFNILYRIGEKIKPANGGINVIGELIEKNGGFQCVYSIKDTVSADEWSGEFCQYVEKRMTSSADVGASDKQDGNDHNFEMSKLVVQGFAREHKISLVVANLIALYYFVEFPFNVDYLLYQMDINKRVLLCHSRVCSHCKRIGNDPDCCDGCEK